ncbi:hypothetical protein Bbelb_069020 [Branchiostoma belcheri]|nr:hypothetical protein Bbelb_069020 [Branchiostoma belcheri]
MIVVYLPFLAVGAVLLVLPTASQSCSVPLGWREMSLNQRVSLADIVVHAKALNKTKTPHNVNVQTAVIQATQENIDNVALTCGLQNFKLPLGGAGNASEQRRCPTHPNESGEHCQGVVLLVNSAGARVGSII